MKNPVWSGNAIRQRMQRRLIVSLAGEVERIVREMLGLGVIRRNVRGAGGNGDRSRQVRLLPTGGRLIREGHRCEQSPVIRPKVANMDAGVRRPPYKSVLP